MSDEVRNDAVVTTAEQKGTTMNVYTALSKRKILQKQLDEALSGSIVVSAAVRKSTDTISGKTREDAINDMKATYDKIQSLIKNIRTINSAIAISNATTKVLVAGKVYTVEELIYRMLHIADEIKFHNAIVKNLNASKIAIEENRKRYLEESVIAEHVSKLVPTLVAPDATTEERDNQAKAVRESYIMNMEMELVDPYDLLNKTEDRVRELTEFKEEVNNALNLSNIQTMITVNLEG